MSSDPECIFILPSELIDAVFAQLDDWIELVFLCATCRDLWNIGARHLISFAEQRIAKCSAIGQRLIVLGDYNDEGFFPPSLHIPLSKKVLDIVDAKPSPLCRILADKFSCYAF